MNAEIEISGIAVGSDAALSGNPQPATVLYARRDIHGQRIRSSGLAASVTGCTGLRKDPTRAAAGVTYNREMRARVPNLFPARAVAG